MADRSEVLTASLTLIRPAPNGVEVFWARRRANREFLGGFHAFFAGSVEASDPDLETAALRECFEECGLLVTGEGLRRFAPQQRDPRTLKQVSNLATDRLEKFGWWTTPKWLDPTFHTAFFGLRLSAEEGEVLDDLADDLDSREFATGEWITPFEALDRWWHGRAYTTRPVRAVLQSLSDAPSREATTLDTPLGSSKEQSATAQTVEICGGVVVLPLRTPTLPPATHTNCLILGHERFAIVDPGPTSPDALEPLIDHLATRRRAGHRCIALVVTHHHPDHVGGLQPLSQHLDVPLFAHRETLERLEDPPFSTQAIEDGHRLEIDHPGELRAIFTPGHAPGHLAFYQPRIDLVVAGDLVASKGTIVIDPPQGNMGQYLASLRRIQALNARALLPAHGAPITAPQELLDHYLAHRNMREDRVLDALRRHGPAAAPELVPHVYRDAPEAVWPLAARSLAAHLLHLVELELAVVDDGIYSAL